MQLENSSATAPAVVATIPAPPAGPSIHRRAVITWLAIFPSVLLGQVALFPVIGDWPLVLRTAVLTAVVVPLAVYLVVPQLMKANARLARRRPPR